MDSRDNNRERIKPAIIGTDKPAAFSRRAVLRGASATPLAMLAASCSSPQATVPATTAAVLPAEVLATLEAFSERIIPADGNGPGARDAGVVRYIERSLAEWNRNDVPLLTEGLRALDQAATTRHGQTFASLAAEQQDALMLAMEQGQIDGFANAQAVFNRLHRLTLEGMFSDPYWGGNADYAGWDLIGYPGAVLGSTIDMQKMNGRLPPLHTSAYGAEHDGH